jgi:hypothetical protein
MKFVLALSVLACVVVGCSSKQDVGDAEVKVAPGAAKMPGAPSTTPGGGAGSGPAPSAASPATPK